MKVFFLFVLVTVEWSVVVVDCTTKDADAATFPVHTPPEEVIDDGTYYYMFI